MATFTFELADPEALNFQITDPETLHFELGESGQEPAHPYYDGPYEVTPTRRDQTLETAAHIMRRDVTVWAIPYSKTTNPAGGMTASIGGA